jgi:replicative DNA helicase
MVDAKLPPHSQEAETSVLGAVLINKDAVVDVSEFLRPEHFYENRHQDIFSAMIALYESRVPIDVVTLAEKLKNDKKLKEIGGAAYLAELSGKVPTAAHIEHYGRIVKDLFVKRQLMNSAAKIVELATDESIETAQVLDRAEQDIFSLSQQHLAQAFVPVKAILASSFDRLDELHKNPGGLRGVSTGFTDLDDALAGMQKSNLLIIASRPGVGKTTLALNIAMHAAVRDKRTVGFFSLEMSSEELMDRLLVAKADIDAWKMRTGRLEEEEFTRLSEAMGELYESSLYIDETPGASILEMRTKARRLQVDHGLDLLIVDYLQLVRGRNLENRVQEVSEISQGLKNLARELKVPVLALSQLSRAVEQRTTKKPQLADLRESGAIEQDADVVMFLWREDEDNLENINLDIAKHRNGPLKSIKLRFRGDRISFYSMETKRA